MVVSLNLFLPMKMRTPQGRRKRKYWGLEFGWKEHNLSLFVILYIYFFKKNYKVRELYAKCLQGPMNRSRNPLNLELVIIGVL